MINLPVASVDRSFAEKYLVNPTRAGTLLSHDNSALGLFSAHLNVDDLGTIAYATDGQSQIVVLVNYFEAPLTVSVETQSDGSLYYGSQIGRPSYYLFNKQVSKYLPTTTSGAGEIPAGNKRSGKVGVGAFLTVEGSPFYGVGGLASISSTDRNLEGKNVFLAFQFALNPDSSNIYRSVALSDVSQQYNTPRDFYDKECDNTRSGSASLVLNPGQGKLPDHAYKIEAHSTLVQGAVPFTSSNDVGTLLMHQAVVSFKDGGS